MEVLSNYTYSQIDKGMRKIIKILNEKGYLTTMCCEGHLNNKIWQAFIIFKENYNFSIPIPIIGIETDSIKNKNEIFTYTNGKEYRWFNYKKKTTNKQKEQERLELLKELELWACNLPCRDLVDKKLYILLAKDKKGNLRTIYSKNTKGDYETIITKKKRYGYTDFEEKVISLGKY